MARPALPLIVLSSNLVANVRFAVCFARSSAAAPVIVASIGFFGNLGLFTFTAAVSFDNSIFSALTLPASGLEIFALIVAPSCCMSRFNVIAAALNACELPSRPGMSSLTIILPLPSPSVASSTIFSPLTLSFVMSSLGTSNLTLRSPPPACLPVAVTTSFEMTNSLPASLASTSPLAVAARLLMPAAIPFALKSNPASA